MTGDSYQGGIAHAEKGESNGRFYISWIPAQVITAGDLGRGSGPCEAAFLTEEGRAYFIQAELMREKCAALAAELEWVQRQLREIAAKKEKRRQQRLARLGVK